MIVDACFMNDSSLHYHKATVRNDVLFDNICRLLESDKEVIIRVKGNSMLPFIVGDQDSVLLRKAESFRRYDIALARLRNGQYVLHRILSIRNGLVTLMGDGNLVGKEYCREEDLQARAEAIIHEDGKRRSLHGGWFGWVQKNWVWMLPIRRILLGFYKRVKTSSQ